MNQEKTPRSMDELLVERDRLMTALLQKDEQTRVNIAAEVILEGERDEDKEALEAELEEINEEIKLLTGDDDHPRLEGI